MRVGWSASRCCSTSSSRRCSEGSLRGGSAQGFREPLGCGDHCRRVHPAGLAGETLERARDRDGGDDLPAGGADRRGDGGHALLALRSEEHTSELQSLMRISYAVFCLKKKKEQTSE